MSAVAGLHRLVTERRDGAALGRARVVVGVGGMLGALEARGILQDLSAERMLHMPVWSWTAHWPGTICDVLWIAWLIGAAGMTLGLFTRASCLLVALAAFGFVQMDQQFYSNHVYLLALLGLLFLMGDAGAAVSCDALLGGRRRVPAWPIALLKLQLSTVYMYAAISKCNVVYLSGAVLGNNLLHGPLGRFPQLVDSAAWMAGTAMVSVLVEAALATGMWVRRWRDAWVMAGTVFHLGLVVLFPANQRPGLVVFSLEMFGLYLLFPSDSPESPPGSTDRSGAVLSMN